MLTGLFSRVSFNALLIGLSVSYAAACGGDSTAPPVGAAGTAAIGGGAGTLAGAAGQTAPVTAGTGMTPSGVGAAGSTTAPTGAAGTAAPAAGAAGMAAPTGAAGSGVAGMAAPAAGAGAAGMAAPAFTPGSPTWSAVFQEIIVGTGCNGGPTCHAGTAAGQLKMATKAESYTNLVGVKAAGINLVMGSSPNCKDSTLVRVVAGQPDMSLLYKKVATAMPECGGKMPPSGAMLTQAQLTQIRTWIMNGAKDD